METKVTPWDVEGSIDYSKLIEEFGVSPLFSPMKEKLTSRMKEGSHMIKREFFFTHRDLDLVLKDYESGKGFFLYTGRGPSGDMHIGHIIPLLFTKYLQDAFDVNLYIQITDDEKYLYKKDRKWKEIDEYSIDNIKHIAALGFNPDKTFIFRNSEYISNVYPMLNTISKKITFSTAKAVFGFTNETNIGFINFPAYQLMPTFFEKKRCLIPAAIDQDPYWRIQRDFAESLGYFKVAAIHSKFLPPLTGMDGKMSSSKSATAIFLTDDEKTVKNKINKYAFSGGQVTLEKHREKGGNTEVDVPYQWLKIFFEPDDEELMKIKREYERGNLLSGEIKKVIIDKINSFLKAHQENVKNVDINPYMYTGQLAKEMWKKKYLPKD